MAPPATKHCDAAYDDGDSRAFQRAHGFVQNEHRENRDPNETKRNERKQHRHFTVFERVDHHHGKNRVQSVTREQRRNGEDSDGCPDQSGLACLGETVRAGFNEHLGDGDQQSASQNDENGLATFGMIDRGNFGAWGSGGAQPILQFSMITIGRSVK